MARSPTNDLANGKLLQLADQDFRQACAACRVLHFHRNYPYLGVMLRLGQKWPPRCFMGNLYVENGTPIGSVSLCVSCSNGHTIEGYRESEVMQLCTYDRSMMIPFKVKSCSNHHDRNKPTWLQMQKLAIPVDARKTFKPVGFLLQPVTDIRNEGDESTEYDDD